MQWVFGQVFVVTDMASGMKVAFDKRITRKCITLDGDVVDPMGTLSGGAPARGSSVLSVVSELCVTQNELDLNKQQLVQVTNDIQNLTKIANDYNSLKQKLELRQHEMEMIRQRLQQTTHHQYQQEFETLKKNISDLKKKIKECDKIETENANKIKELEEKVKNTKAIRDRELKAAEAEMNRLNKKAETSRKQWKEREQESENLNLEVIELQKAMADGQQQIADAMKKLEDLEEETIKVTEQLEIVKVIRSLNNFVSFLEINLI